MQDLSREHHVKFNTPVGDKDDNGNPIDRQFVYFPQHQILVTDGGAGVEEAMRDESIAIGDGVMINANSEHEILKWYWNATLEQRAHHDAIYANEKPPPLTPDGNPPANEAQTDQGQPPEQNIDTSHFAQNTNGNGMPPMQDNDQRRQAEYQEPPQPTAPLIQVDLDEFNALQRQLVVSEYKPIIEMQDMVIQTQAILLRNVLDPGSPHHEVIEAWMSQLEMLRGKIPDEHG